MTEEISGLTAEQVQLARFSPAGWALATGHGNWQLARHLAYIDREVLSAIYGGYNLLLETPPRHGKSEYSSRALPGWFMGRWPDKRVIVASYGVELPTRFGRQVRSDLDEFGRQVFDIAVDPRSRAAHRFDILNAAGGFWGVGVGGGVTGRGGNLIITDDTVKDAEAARSDLQRETLWDWFMSTLWTRREPDSIHIGIMTRWNEDDLHGRIRRSLGSKYKIIRLPAMAEDDDLLGRERGDALWPARYDEEALTDLKEEMPPTWWSALYQQSPSPEDGAIWMRKWWDSNRFTYSDGVYTLGEYRCPESSLTKFTVVDLAFSEKKTADFTSILTVGLTNESPRRMLILANRVGRIPFPELFPAIKAEMGAHGSNVLYMEEEGQQIMVVQAARAAGLPVKTVGRSESVDFKVSGDKVNVAHEATPLASAGRMWLPYKAPWLADLEHNLLVFPNGAHDDIADTVAWACLIAVRMGMHARSPVRYPTGTAKGRSGGLRSVMG
ncbi:MAG: hypothetical protein DRH30_03235 [Deltaproteobacteria bacterium]|nr:MAG: hypothetical protein DRH30_03235 [Deltaproteobacteria bacterium]